MKKSASLTVPLGSLLLCYQSSGNKSNIGYSNNFSTEYNPKLPLKTSLEIIPNNKRNKERRKERRKERKFAEREKKEKKLSISSAANNLTYEIILTLGQAFEVAYQLALQAQKSKSPGVLTAEMIETKSSKPVPKPRASMRKSALEQPEVDQDSQSHASVSWVVEPKQDSKRTLSTKYETTIF